MLLNFLKKSFIKNALFRKKVLSKMHYLEKKFIKILFQLKVPSCTFNDKKCIFSNTFSIKSPKWDF